jgi:hypothetical protein
MKLLPKLGSYTPHLILAMLVASLGFMATVAHAKEKERPIKNVKIEGSITLGPVCGAVIFPNPDPHGCDDHQYKTTVYFISMDGKVNVAVTSTKKGHYKVKVPAGTYVIRDRASTSSDPIMVPRYYPYLETVGPITVGEEKHVELDLLFNTGIL